MWFGVSVILHSLPQLLVMASENWILSLMLLVSHVILLSAGRPVDADTEGSASAPPSSQHAEAPVDGESSAKGHAEDDATGRVVSYAEG